MKRITILKCTFTLFLLIGLFYSSIFGVFAQPSPPCIFYGYVTIGGAPAQDFLNVTAVIAGTGLVWSTFTKNGTYGWPVKGSSLLEIPSQSSGTQKDGGAPGDYVEFYVNGTQVQEYGIFESASAKRTDLSIHGSSRRQSTITVALTFSTAYQGFEVNMSGTLADLNGNGISGTDLSAYYSVAGSQSWNSIASFNTAVNGDYQIEWMPASTGNYTVRVSWGGNGNFNATEAFTNLTTLALEQKYVFSVFSNSTISELAFNSTSRILSFTLNGPSGTTGYANATIPKNLITDPNRMKIYLDDDQINFTTIANDASWLLHFTYQHSTHKVVVDLSLPTQPFFETALGIATLFGIIAILIVTIYIGNNRLRRPKETKPIKPSLKTQKSRERTRACLFLN